MIELFPNLHKKYKEFDWSNVQEGTFDNLKWVSAVDSVVSVFDANKWVTLPSNASEQSISRIFFFLSG